MAKLGSRNNLGLAGIFVLFVFGLIFLSFLVKIFFFIKDTKFDGKHQFNIEVLSNNSIQFISLSPPTRSISILSTDLKGNVLKNNLEVPIDGVLLTSTQVNKDNLSEVFFRSIFTFGHNFRKMNYVDVLRIFLFSKTVLLSSIYQRELLSTFNDQQKSTLVSLTFTDPTIYQENKSIQIINSTQTYGLGNKLAKMITNIGGNVILVTSMLEGSKPSQIIYFGDKSYTADRLSKILNYPLIKTDKKSIADVIIIIGEDKRGGF
jgi:hypothetical protein